MGAPQVPHETDECPQSRLEWKYLQEYLRSQGASLEALGDWPKTSSSAS